MSVDNEFHFKIFIKYFVAFPTFTLYNNFKYSKLFKI